MIALDGREQPARNQTSGTTPTSEDDGEQSPVSEPLEIWVSDPNVGPGSEGIDGFYRTREAAVRGVKRRFGDPYEVSWSEHGSTNKGLLLRGEFSPVPGYCTDHVAEWFILPVTVEP